LEESIYETLLKYFVLPFMATVLSAILILTPLSFLEKILYAILVVLVSLIIALMYDKWQRRRVKKQMEGIKPLVDKGKVHYIKVKTVPLLTL
jgi:membrane protein implicated in regulation of membrane protease activity